ncbi:uncharacterized protein LOC131846129 [Achroia grisella]|uniref:uncharacterized protein LOC131846129 n=1 Tax=Achroia grisella TaxID=688607 RepID=UPI0027D30921|nr:uncharacterized protein LOC131846129 [Achroia grisella]
MYFLPKFTVILCIFLGTVTSNVYNYYDNEESIWFTNPYLSRYIRSRPFNRVPIAYPPRFMLGPMTVQPSRQQGVYKYPNLNININRVPFISVPHSPQIGIHQQTMNRPFRPIGPHVQYGYLPNTNVENLNGNFNNFIKNDVRPTVSPFVRPSVESQSTTSHEHKPYDQVMHNNEYGHDLMTSTASATPTYTAHTSTTSKPMPSHEENHQNKYEDFEYEIDVRNDTE